MIIFQVLSLDHVSQLQEIDRSEHIDLIYEMNQDELIEIKQVHECPNWEEDLLKEIRARYLFELQHGGIAVGAFYEKRLVGFGVLAHKLRGNDHDRLQIDLMYVSRDFRRKGIGTSILNRLGDEARRRGAKYLYVSSTETRSAVTFYRSQGSQMAEEIDQELYDKEPRDIHMIIKL